MPWPWEHQPTFPAALVEKVVPDIIAAKNTIPHHEAKRLAPILLAVALNAAAQLLSDDALRPFGLRRL